MAKGSVVSITLTADDKTGRGIQSATANIEGFGGKLSGAATSFATFAGVVAAQALPQIVDFGKELFSLGSEVEIMGNKVNTVFGAQANSIKDWADRNNEALGISDEKLAGLAANMGDLLVPIGFTRQAAADLTTQTLDAAGALAAWSGGQYDAAEVSEILTKAMLGEREQLKSLGISINQAEVDQRAMAIAAAEGRKEITAMDKALATQQLILEKSTDAQKAWNDGTMDNVKAQNEIKAQIDDLKVALAQGLTPVIQKVVGFITGSMIPAIQKVVGFIKDNWVPIVAGLTAAFLALIPTLLAAAAAGWAAIAPMLIAAAPFIAVGAAIAALTAGIIWLWENWTPLQTAVDATVTFFKDEVLPVFETVVSFFVDKVVPAVWAIAEVYVKMYLKVAEMIMAVVGAVAGFVRDVIGFFANLVSDIVGKVTEIVETIIGIPGRIAETALIMWDAIKTSFTTAKDWVVDGFEYIVEFITGLPERIWNAAVGMFDGVKDAFKTAMNWVIDKWNSIDLGWSVSIPSWVPVIGGKGFSIPDLVPDIPRLAAGGIVTSPTLALIGEAGPEAVVPLGKGGGMGSTINITVNAGVGADGASIGRQIVEKIRAYERVNGPGWRAA